MGIFVINNDAILGMDQVNSSPLRSRFGFFNFAWVEFLVFPLRLIGFRFNLDPSFLKDHIYFSLMAWVEPGQVLT